MPTEVCRQVQPYERDAPEFAALRAACQAHDGAEAFQHMPPTPEQAWAINDNDGSLAAYAAAQRLADGRVQTALGVRPDRRHRGHAAELSGAVAAYAAGAPVVAWSTSPGAASDALALATGAQIVRRLWRLRVTLPLRAAAGSAAPPSGYVFASFDPADTDAIVAVNAAAFVDLPDQAAMTADDIAARRHQASFDPDGFVVARDRAGDVAGFCWTMRHAPERSTDDAVGEIYVIGVAPSAQGTGLGRSLCVAGFAHLARSCPVGMLYVDEANTAARSLYHSLGMRLDQVHACYHVAGTAPIR